MFFAIERQERVSNPLLLSQWLQEIFRSLRFSWSMHKKPCIPALFKAVLINTLVCILK